MPLAFESDSHGVIAFGFFNIESDMLLLDHYFFFATDFCEAIGKMSNGPGGVASGVVVPAYVISDSDSIGDLHGGIAGTHFSGFIGETYKKYPFPRDSEKFKQQTDGFKTKGEFERMIKRFGKAIDLKLFQNNKKEQVSIGQYLFSLQNFSQLLDYVIQGGYPGWLNRIAPDYVVRMATLENFGPV